jgi:hypothetical protein
MLQEGCLHLPVLITLLQMAVMRFRMRGKSQIPLSGTRIPSVLQCILLQKQQYMPIDLFPETFFNNLLQDRALVDGGAEVETLAVRYIQT